MLKGTVKFFNARKGFGFITPDESDKEVFFPVASIGSTDVSNLKTGQRVSFETQPDAKGPKAVNLTMLADRPVPKIVKTPSPQPSHVEHKPKLTIYHDPGYDRSRKALAALRAAGHEPHIIDYIATPPTRDELKNLSLLLRESDQTLVKKYDPLFFELRLDDRFISENEFWGAIFEHPSLINGPIVATPTKASVCRSEDAVRYFLAVISPSGIPLPPKPKSLSERALRLVTGGIATPPAAEAAAQKAKEKPPANVAKQAKAMPEEKPKSAAKAKAKTATKAKAKTPVPAKKAAKKIAAKPVKKGRRAG